MANRVDKIRRKIEARRRKINKAVIRKEPTQPHYYPAHDEFRDEPNFYFPQGKGMEEEKLFRKDIFIFQILASICLFLVIAIMFKTDTPRLDGVRQFVVDSFQKEFEFETIARWYENQFGKPLALLPVGKDIALDDYNKELELAYAVPATGKVTQEFAKDGKGIVIETSLNETTVEAAKDGMVRFVAEEETLGKTVIISHYDGGESWYAMLDKVEVNLYDHVEAGSPIGTVTLDDKKGYYYFALKEGETFINPLEVISFE